MILGLEYSSFLNQAYNILHFLFSIFLIYIFVPYISFGIKTTDKVLSIVSNAIIMALLVIILGYILIPLKLYEVIALFLIFLVISQAKYFIHKKYRSWEDIIHALKLWLLIYYDGIKKPVQNLKKKSINLLHFLRRFLKRNILKPVNLILMSFFIICLCSSVYIRFHNSTVNAAPALSDAYIGIEWTKDMLDRNLFGMQEVIDENGQKVLDKNGRVKKVSSSGYYPRGFHITLATIKKLAAVDVLYVFNYMGPFNSFLIGLGMFFVLYHATKRIGPGIAAMAIFALLYEVMPYSADRHTATNAQEYASLFFLPVLYICFLYIKRKDRYMLFISFTGLCLIGLIHNLVQLYTAIGLVSLGFSALIINPKKYIKSIIFLSIIAVLSVGVSLFPMIFSNLMSVQIHEATASYLTSVVLNPEIPAINTRDLFALCLLSIPVFSVLLDKRRYYILTFEKFILIFSIFSFIVYYYGPWLTKNNVLETRIRDLWALVLPMIYGISLYSFTKIFKHIKTKKLIDVFILSILFIYIFVYNKPEPIIPYKMQWNSKVEQYLRINSTHNPLTYAIASGFTEYALVKGNGYHLRLKEDFLDVYNPFWIPLTENGSTAPDSELPEHIFIYYDKIVYKNKGMLDHERMAPIYEKEEKAAKEAREWIDIYSKNADNITEYYDDEYLTVYYIHQPKSREEKRKELWGIDY